MLASVCGICAVVETVTGVGSVANFRSFSWFVESDVVVIVLFIRLSVGCSLSFIKFVPGGGEELIPFYWSQ